MPSPSDLPFMLQLADDTSETVQHSLGAGFSAFGPELENLLAALEPPATHEQRQRVRCLVQDYRREWLREQWHTWFSLPGERERLEAAMSLLVGFQDGPSVAPRVGELLNGIANDFFNTLGEHNPLTLAKYLFHTRGLAGAEPDYWLPQNSNLRHVIDSRRGIPISLSIIYVLIAHRLGYEVTACNWPKHFLATAWHEGEHYVIDGFRGGQCVDVESFLNQQGPSRDAARQLLTTDTPSELIIGRVLNNLVRQYQYVEHFPNAQLMTELLKDIDRRQHTRAQR